jgi:hypothetical protein
MECPHGCDDGWYVANVIYRSFKSDDRQPTELATVVCNLCHFTWLVDPKSIRASEQGNP